MDTEKEKRNTTNYICTICTKTFTTKSNLNDHMKRIHKQFKKNTKSSLKCPLCTMLLENYGELDKHLTSIHNEFLKKEEYSFETIEKFNAWKLEMEKETLCFFKLMNSRKVKDRKIVKYICHRSGTYTPRVLTRKKALKVKGSNKIGSNCPARLVVTISHNGSVKVDYFSTHIGHDLEVGRVNLTNNERQNIAGKLLQGIPIQRIVQDIRDEFNSNKRLSYTTVHDIHNIKRSLNIQSNVLFHEEDTTSVNILIEELDNLKKMEDVPDLIDIDKVGELIKSEPPNDEFSETVEKKLKRGIKNQEIHLKLKKKELETDNSEQLNQPDQIFQSVLLTNIKKEPDSNTNAQDVLLFEVAQKKNGNIKIEDKNIKSDHNDEILHNLQEPGPSSLQHDANVLKVEPMEENNDSLIFKCGFCGELSNNQRNLDNHFLKNHSDEDNMLSCVLSRIYKCRFGCGFKTVFFNRLKKHEDTKHKYNAKEHRELFECSECPYKTFKNSHFRKHMKKHKDIYSNISIRCESCKIMCRGQRGLDSHILYKHPTEDIANNISSRIYTCQVCLTYKAVFRANIKRHMKETHEKNLLACSYCKFKTTLKSELIVHEKTHNSDLEANKCTCNERFLTKTKLDKHIIEKHYRNKKLLATVTCNYHQCELCEFCTITTCLLNKHKRRNHSVEPGP